MKKFLSLVLAMIMTMSLVTISAGATEYKDLTDKDEIQYEEAVAVLNRIGVITGYDDGSFRPETELTRGAAAKIIVSLLIGPEAASNLPNTYAPYPDVPANHTFAGVISYCKTAGIISGYGDGTFKPANSLTGYAFAKMLLGAIGYDSKIQGYTDTGWTMNVARDGNIAGLFNRIEFDGAAAVNRETACQLALNTLKATMVEYTGGLNVTAGNATVTTAPTLTYKISNQSYATNISNRKASNIGNADVNNHYTVEFGEEHFKDLRLNDEHGTKYSTNASGKTVLNVARDEFGRPANKWSYKKVTIGTFPIEPDFVYAERVIHLQDEKVTAAAKVRALELSGYNLKADDKEDWDGLDTTLWVNGVDRGNALAKVADIADWTDNGTVVEVYVSEDDSDFIQDVVVVKTQLMEIKNIKSEAVALKLYDDGSDNTSGDGIGTVEGVIGFNSRPLDKKVNDVEVNDECYKTLSGMKVGDIVAVIPVAPEHENTEKFDVSYVYVPETVSGELTWVDTYGTEKTKATGIAVTVGGTDYNVALWNKDLTNIDGTKIRVTRKDVTLYLDEFGNALLAKNVGSTSDYMIIGGYHSGLVDGKVVTYADGWDIKGNEISLNIGNARYDTIGGDGRTSAPFKIGTLVHYSSSTTSKYAEWTLDELGVFDVASKRTGETVDYTVKASNSRVVLNDYKTAAGGYNNSDSKIAYTKDNDSLDTYDDALNDNVYVDDSGVKVIYLTMGDDNEVDSIEVKSGMQNISNKEILGEKSGFTLKRAQACVGLKSGAVTADSLVKAIVVKLESGSADLKDLVYVSRYLGSAGKAAGADNTQRPVYGYEVHFVGQDNWDDEVTIYSFQDLDKGDFARARKPVSVPEGVKNVSEDNFYTLTKYVKTQKALSTIEEGKLADFNIKGNKTLIEVGEYKPADTNFCKEWPKDDLQNELDLGDQDIINILSLRGAKIIDLTKYEIQSTSELVDEMKELKKDGKTFTISALYNDDKDSDGFRDVHVLIITGTGAAPAKAADKHTVKVTGTGIEAVADKKVTDGESVTFTIKAAANKGITEIQVPADAKATVTTDPATLPEGTGATEVKVTVANVKGDVTLTVVTADAAEDPSEEGYWEIDEDGNLVWVEPANPKPSEGYWGFDKDGNLVWIEGTQEGSEGDVGAISEASVQNASPLDKYIGKYIRVSNSAIAGMGPYTVFCTTNAKGQTMLQFGKDIDKQAVLDALNGSGLGKKAFIPDVANVTEASEEQIKAWKGETEPEPGPGPDDPPPPPPAGVKGNTSDVGAGINDTAATIYTKSGEKATDAQIVTAMAQALGVPEANLKLKNKTVTATDPETGIKKDYTITNDGDKLVEFDIDGAKFLLAENMTVTGLKAKFMLQMPANDPVVCGTASTDYDAEEGTYTVPALNYNNDDETVVKTAVNTATDTGTSVDNANVMLQAKGPNGWVPVTVGTHVVVVNTPIRVTYNNGGTPDAIAGTYVGVKVNDKEVSLTRSTSSELGASNETPAVGDKDGVCTVVAGAGMYKVFVDGVAVKGNGDWSDKSLVETTIKFAATAAAYVCETGDKPAQAFAPAVGAFQVGDEIQYTLDAADDAKTGESMTPGEIRLTSAGVVATDVGTASPVPFKAYEVKADGSKGSEISNATKILAVGDTVLIEAARTNATLKVAPGASCGPLTAVDSPLMAQKATYKVTITKSTSINKDSIVYDYILSGKNAADSAITQTVTGVTISGDDDDVLTFSKAVDGTTGKEWKVKLYVKGFTADDIKVKWEQKELADENLFEAKDPEVENTNDLIIELDGTQPENDDGDITGVLTITAAKGNVSLLLKYNVTITKAD